MSIGEWNIVTSPIFETEKLTDSEDQDVEWKDLNWKKANRYVRRLQNSMAKCIDYGNSAKSQKLQKIWFNSYSAKITTSCYTIGVTIRKQQKTVHCRRNSENCGNKLRRGAV